MYFTTRFTAATVHGRPLFKGDHYSRTAFIKLRQKNIGFVKNLLCRNDRNDATWHWSHISHCSATKQYIQCHGTSSLSSSNDLSHLILLHVSGNAKPSWTVLGCMTNIIISFTPTACKHCLAVPVTRLFASNTCNSGSYSTEQGVVRPFQRCGYYLRGGH